MTKPLELLDNPVRKRLVRFQIEALERIRDDVVMALPMRDREEWVDALEPLTIRLYAELECHEGTGSMGALMVAGFMDMEMDG